MHSDPNVVLRLVKKLPVNKLVNAAPMSVLALIDALGKKDPASALSLAQELAQMQPSTQNIGYLLEAASCQPPAQARQFSRTFSLAEIAGISGTLPGQTLLIRSSRKICMPNVVSNWKPRAINYHSFTDGVPTDRIRYAYLISSLDPVEARLILESGYTVSLMRARDGSRA